MRTGDGPRQQVVDGAALDLLGDQARAHEQRDQDPEQRDPGEREVHGEALPLAHRERAQNLRREEQHQACAEDACDHPIAGRLAKRVARDQRGGHATLRP